MNKVFCFATSLCFVCASCQESKSVKVLSVDNTITEQAKIISSSASEDSINTTLASADLIEPNLGEFKRKDEPHILKEKKAAPIKKVKKPKVLPVIVFEEPLYEVGEIKEGDVIEHKFYFTNDGKVPLEILKAEGTCGCTVPSFPFMGVEPGKKGFIGVQYHSVGKSGAQRPEINVTTNGTPSMITLALDIEVLDQESSVPTQLDSTQKTN